MIIPTTYDLRPMTAVSRMRLDKFLQVSRLVKRRALANELCDRGRVRVNGQRAKATAHVKAGDVIAIAQGDRRLIAKVLDVPERPTPSKDLVEVLSRLHVDDLETGNGKRGTGNGLF